MEYAGFRGSFSEKKKKKGYKTYSFCLQAMPLTRSLVLAGTPLSQAWSDSSEKLLLTLLQAKSDGLI